MNDLRRTVSTGMNERGVLPHGVDALLDHISGSRDVVDVYNHTLYNVERRVALDQESNFSRPHNRCGPLSRLFRSSIGK
ncbi:MULTISPECIES: hypothetical protein [Methylobacterium]|uniref:hypothetical protein n=1 Tax=Methylobacterium TaxID=407 RepID=UPI000FE14A6E|nr:MULTISPECIES: hypothetical protein [Methylobacterium]MBN4096158.1 hypothetical protein [Methylobacterium sp. OT2]UIN36942.1 hypothetical protein LXM90_10770 [Methylobacterium oryzae]